MTQSIFAEAAKREYGWRYEVELVVHELHGGTPMNQQVAVDHIRRQLAERADLLREAVADYLSDKTGGEGQPPSPGDIDEAAAAIAMAKNLTGFRKDPEHGLYVEGRHLKACLKEAVSIAVNAGAMELKGWGETKKWATKWFPEHVFVQENRLFLGRYDPDDVAQRFIVSRHGTGISLEEFVVDAKVTATIVADHDLGQRNWEAIWTRAEKNGLGASRSQGYGQFVVTRWDQVSAGRKKAKKGASANGEQTEE